MTWMVFVIGSYKNVVTIIMIFRLRAPSLHQTFDATQRPSRRQAYSAETGLRVSQLSACVSYHARVRSSIGPQGFRFRSKKNS